MNLLAIIFAILATCALAYQFGTYFALSFFLKRPLPRLKKTSRPGISLLKPVKGLDQDTSACLASFINQEYPAGRFCLASLILPTRCFRF